MKTVANKAKMKKKKTMSKHFRQSANLIKTSKCTAIVLTEIKQEVSTAEIPLLQSKFLS